MPGLDLIMDFVHVVPQSLHVIELQLALIAGFSLLVPMSLSDLML